MAATKELIFSSPTTANHFWSGANIGVSAVSASQWFGSSTELSPRQAAGGSSSFLADLLPELCNLPTAARSS